jgi:hypothetical protein
MYLKIEAMSEEAMVIRRMNKLRHSDKFFFFSGVERW